MQIEGLTQQGSVADRPKKVVYGKKKKPVPGVKEASPAPDDKESVQASTPDVQSPAPVHPELPDAPSPVTAPPESVKDEWDAESEDEKLAAEPAKADVKSDWDASSSDEEVKKPAPPKIASPSASKCKFIEQLSWLIN